MEGRNGRFGVESLEVSADGEMVLVRGVSRRLHRALRGGLDIGIRDMDKLAEEWLLARGKRKVVLTGVRRAFKALGGELGKLP